MARRHGYKRGLIFSLCLADLKNESLLTLCMILAVASVLAPLLILFGLKYGTVETLRQRLIMDPRNSEIRPMSVQTFPQSWFEAIRAHPNVAFVVPTTRQLATSVEIAVLGTAGTVGKNFSVDAIPTAPGDPLILQNGFQIPLEGECLVSTPAHQETGLEAGQEILMTVRRVKGSGFETGTTRLKVTGVLPMRAGATKAILLPLPLLEAIENYKDGMGVPALGWEGELPRAYPVFSSMLVYAPERFDTETGFRLTNNTGFIQSETISAERAGELAGTMVPAQGVYTLLSTKGTPAGITNILTIRNLLGGKGARLFPLAGDLEVVVVGADKVSHTFTAMPASGLNSSPEDSSLTGAPWLETFAAKQSPAREWTVMLVAPDAGIEPGEALASVSVGDNSVTVPVRIRVSSQVKPGKVHLPLRLLGTFGLLASRPVTWDVIGQDFLLSKRGYAGFRLYADRIENVGLLRAHFETLSLNVHTEAERIDDVLRLDTYLSLIFWLIALGSVLGGAACLLSNIYAGLERKRRELAVLRLLGLYGTAFYRFPLYTASFFATFGFLVALGLFSALALAINLLFAGHLQAGESLCRLALWHPLVAYGLTLAIALVAGIIAARRAGKIEPAEALRND